MGVYHRSVYVTTPATGLVTVCRPGWFICFPTAVTVDTVVASRGSTDPGISFGGGFTYSLSNLATFFAEARYHYVWGPDVNNGGRHHERERPVLPADVRVPLLDRLRQGFGESGLFC